MHTEIQKVIKEGYQVFYDKAMEELTKVEETAKAKVEEMVKDDKERLQKIIDMCMEEKEVEVEDVVEEVVETETTEQTEIVGE